MYKPGSTQANERTDERTHKQATKTTNRHQVKAGKLKPNKPNKQALSPTNTRPSKTTNEKKNKQASK
jgi:hypothetical protein